MTKLKEAIHLDYMTLRPYLVGKNLLLFSAVALFLTVASGNISSGISAGLMIATLFVSYPFALGEKSNLDALYITLAISRKTVVLGRYLFTWLLNLCAVLFSFALATVGLFIAKAAGFSPGMSSEGYLQATLLLSAIFVLIQAIQLPVFFRLGYTKARVLSIVPLATLMAGYMAFMALNNATPGPGDFLGKLAGSGAIVPVLIALMVIAVWGSYAASVTFYKKREF